MHGMLHCRKEPPFRTIGQFRRLDDDGHYYMAYSVVFYGRIDSFSLSYFRCHLDILTLLYYPTSFLYHKQNTLAQVRVTLRRLSFFLAFISSTCSLDSFPPFTDRLDL